MAPADTKVFLGEFETKALLDLETRTAGTYLVKMMTRGNSLLSSVFVKSIDPGASVTVNYFQTTSGTEFDSERFDLNSHGTLSGAIAGKTFQIVVPDIHNKPQCEVIVAGGNVEFGVYATLVGYTVQPGVYLDGQDADVLADGGIPIVVYDDASGKFFLLRSVAGHLSVDIDGPGVGEVIESAAEISPGPAAVIASATVGVGEVWRIRYGEVVCRGLGRWKLVIDGIRVAGGATSAAREHDRTELPPSILAMEGQVVELWYAYNHGPPNIDIDAFIGISKLVAP